MCRGRWSGFQLWRGASNRIAGITRPTGTLFREDGLVRQPPPLRGPPPFSGRRSRCGRCANLHRFAVPLLPEEGGHAAEGAPTSTASRSPSFQRKEVTLRKVRQPPPLRGPPPSRGRRSRCGRCANLHRFAVPLLPEEGGHTLEGVPIDYRLPTTDYQFSIPFSIKHKRKKYFIGFLFQTWYNDKQNISL